MPYAVGIILGIIVTAFARVIGFDRDRSFYPTTMIVIAAYYPLFAVMSGSTTAIEIEVLVALGFATLAVIGYQRAPLLVAAAIAGHGAFDFLGHGFIDNPGMPQWWPAFCGTIDIVIGAWVAFLSIPKPASDPLPTH